MVWWLWFPVGILLLPLAAILLYVVSMAILEVISKIRLNFYSKQGIKTFYYPVYGITEFFKSEMGERDGLRKFRNIVSDMKDHDLIAINYPMKFRPIVVMLDSALTKEFFLNELNFVKRMFPFDLKLKGGFLFDYSHRGHHMRSIFSTFFSNENLAKIMPSIRKIIKDHFEEHIKIPKELAMLLNYKKEINTIIINIVNLVLFGEKDIPMINGVTVTEELVETVCSMISEKGIYNKWNIYSMDFLNKFNILPNSKKVVESRKEINKIILETYNRRKKQPKETLGCNLIDLMIIHNQQAEEQGNSEDILTEEEIIGCIITLQFASADTTKHLTMNVLYFLGMNVRQQVNIQQEIERCKLADDSTDYAGLDSSEFFNCFMKECLRMFGPGVQSFDREVIKDFKLGKYKFSKGTIIVVPFNANAVSEKYFDEPYRFDPSRFTVENSKKIDKMAYHPFGFGKRGCFGQNLGVMISKLIVIHILEKYVLEFDATQCRHPYYMVSITYGVSSCFLYTQHRHCNTINQARPTPSLEVVTESLGLQNVGLIRNAYQRPSSDTPESLSENGG